ncbi:GyrI-like domain-containing protein [Lentzea nigeriaca]|uniref:GyrI-like domain-containing protein n=1 Tax=Lentzea nigeriaca TaxID=1128665 RepID=UPI001EF8FE77|nr:GyrI-like domain-containing protein [Lentzea nigeriaca]
MMQRYDIQPQILAEQPTAVAMGTVAVSEIGPWLTKTYNDIAAVLAGCGIEPTGAPFARYHRLADGRFRVEAGYPVGVAIDRADGVHPSVLPGGPAARTVHLGPYEAMESAYGALTSWVRARGGDVVGDAWEIYFSDPEIERDPAAWRTGVVQPYRMASPQR